MTIILIIVGIGIAGIGWLIYGFVTAPYGVEIPFVGFVRTDKDGNPL